MRFLVLCSLFFTMALFSQKKTITHDDYDLWKSISDTKISNEGTIIVSVVDVATRRGDGYVQITNTKTGKKAFFERGYKTAITADGQYVIFHQKPAYEAVRKEKKTKVKKADQSKDKLLIYDVRANRILDSIHNIKGYKLPKKKEGWLVIEMHKRPKVKVKEKKKEEGADEKKDSKKSPSLAEKQDYALVYSLDNKKIDTIHQIKRIAVPENGNAFLFSLKNQKKKSKDIGVYIYNTLNGQRTVVDTTQYMYADLVVDDTSNQFAYISSPDSTAVDSLKYELHLYQNSALKTVVNAAGNTLKEDWILSKDQRPFFSKNGKRLYYGSKPEILFNRDTTLLDEEIPEIDVWSWHDKMIQPEQKVRQKELQEKAFVSYYNTQTGTYIQLQDETIERLRLDPRKEQNYIIGLNTEPYALSRSWASPGRSDFYSINTATGAKKKMIEAGAMPPRLVPNRSLAIYFDMDIQHWFSLNLETGEKRNLTQGLPVVFYDEEDDRPTLPYPYGLGGFDKEGRALIYDRFDIWQISLNEGQAPINLTKNGRLKNIEYRLENLDDEHRELASYLKGKLIVTSFDKSTKTSGLYVLNKGKLIEKIKPEQHFLGRYQKAKETDVVVFSKENFKTYPDLLFTKNDFKTVKKITDINPQEKDFKWGTVEQFSWKAYDGTKLDGLIYKPENFDASKKYPMITYFYEKRSDSYRRHAAPSPSRSIVNPTYLVSNDYIMFVPDIVYTVGQPGEDAYNCIVSGVEAVEKLGYVDSQNLALQGQSWGGYQAAYLVTKTNKFKAAMAGAPVSNMTSAYGGIRWGSGLSRAFQYERTQSRLGKNLWEGFDLYIKNSPLFGIPNIETPLLMMHNDADGAVPYYQGIEMFMGMRRLQKPAWLLVYNKEAHNLTKIKNRQDLSIRMMQFFDHYLKGEPAPVWMTKGLPRTFKGKDFRYELDTD